jgi:uncharacterized protein YoxC
MKIIGLLLITNALVITGWLVTTTGGNRWIISICLIAVFAGIALTFQDRITELTIKGVGTLKAATEQASAKLDEIEAIRKRVESQSATIDLIAKDAKDARELTEDIRKKSADVEKKVKEVDSSVESINVKSKELSLLLEFTNTVVAAQTDDRKAFDQLKKWADSPDAYPYAKEASQAWLKVVDEHSANIWNSGYTVPWKEGIDPSKLDFNFLKKEYQNAHVTLKVPLLEYIWGRNDIPKKLRMQFLIDVIQHDSSLNAVEYAGRYFTNGADLKIKPIAIDYLVNWWNEHSNDIKD